MNMHKFKIWNQKKTNRQKNNPHSDSIEYMLVNYGTQLIEYAILLVCVLRVWLQNVNIFEFFSIVLNWRFFYFISIQIQIKYAMAWNRNDGFVVATAAGGFVLTEFLLQFSNLVSLLVNLVYVNPILCGNGIYLLNL